VGILLENQAVGMEGNADGLAIQWEAVDSSRKYLALLVFYATWRGEFAGKLLKLR